HRGATAAIGAARRPARTDVGKITDLGGIRAERPSLVISATPVAAVRRSSAAVRAFLAMRQDRSMTSPRTIVIAPDSLKGSATAADAAVAIAEGWVRTAPADTFVLRPMADGGEGTLD